MITVLAPTVVLACTTQRPGGIARVGETIILADAAGDDAAVAVVEVRQQAPGTMDQAAQAVPAAERFHGGPVAVYAVRVKIQPTRDLPVFGGTGGWMMLCSASGSAIGASIVP